MGVWVWTPRCSENMVAWIWGPERLAVPPVSTAWLTSGLEALVTTLTFLVSS